MSKKLIPFFERLFSLLVVFLLLASTVIWTGRFFGKDWLNDSADSEINVKQSIEAPTKEELAVLGLTDKELVPRDSMTWTVVSASKEKQGVVLSSSLFTKEFIGYAGTTPLFVYVDKNGVVQSVAPGANEETPSFFRRAAKGVLDKWNGLSAEKALAQEVDVVSGATYTSQSLIDNVRSVLAVYVAADVSRSYEPVIGWARTLALFFVFALGLITSWRYRSVRWLRLIVLLLNTGVTGFWCGQFLSVSVLRGLIQNGTDVVLYLPTVVMLLMAILLPYFGKKNYYCLWMCPYGSLQELAWKLPVPKIKVGSKVFKRMQQIRMAVLMILLASLWMGIGLSVLEYEPFSAFIVSTAAPAVMIMAAAFVVLGIFIPRPWCQCVCPVGTLLNLAEEKK